MKNKKWLSLLLAATLAIGSFSVSYAAEPQAIDEVVEEAIVMTPATEEEVSEFVIDDEETVSEDEIVVEEEISEDAVVIEEDEEIIEEDVMSIDEADVEAEDSVSGGFAYTGNVDGYKIIIDAGVGILPDDAEVVIKKVDKVKGEEVENLIRPELDEDILIKKVVAFDIAFYVDGKEVEPKNGNVSVRVMLNDTMKEVLASSLANINEYDNESVQINVFHVNDELQTELMSASIEGNDTVAFEAESFSAYVFAAVERVKYDGNVIEADNAPRVDAVQYSYDVNKGLPKKYDGRSKMTPLRDQGMYGTCWAHAAIACAEGSTKKKGVKNPDYSERHLAYFMYNTKVDPMRGTKGDSSKTSGDPQARYSWDVGGNSFFSQFILATWQGAANESVAPYKSFGPVAASKAYKDAAHLRNSYALNIKNDRASVKKMIQKNGAVAISYCSSMYYYNSTYNSYYFPYSYGTNHAVSVVGWDDNFSRNKFGSNKPAGNGAWLVRNSWTTAKKGTSEYNSYAGYFWMSYYDKSLSDTAYAMEFDKASKYNNNYQYDGAPDTANIYLDSYSSVTAANKFKIKSGAKKETVKAVSFYTPVNNVNYKIKIYKNPKGSNPESGTLVSTTTGKTTYAGINTVDLKKAPTLKKGDTFTAVVTLSKSSGSVCIGFEDTYDYGWIKSKSSMSSGQSYVKSRGKWYDWKSYRGSSTYLGNVRIKAYTVNKK